MIVTYHMQYTPAYRDTSGIWPSCPSKRECSATPDNTSLLQDLNRRCPGERVSRYDGVPVSGSVL